VGEDDVAPDFRRDGPQRGWRRAREDVAAGVVPAVVARALVKALLLDPGDLAPLVGAGERPRGDACGSPLELDRLVTHGEDDARAGRDLREGDLDRRRARRRSLALAAAAAQECRRTEPDQREEEAPALLAARSPSGFVFSHALSSRAVGAAPWR
jgi:hypothetical protein